MTLSNLPIICRQQNDQGECRALATAMVTITALDDEGRRIDSRTDYYCSTHAQIAEALVISLTEGYRGSTKYVVERIPLTHPGRENESLPSVERR